MSDGPYRVEHDQSKNLEKYHDLLQRFIDHDDAIELRQTAIASFKFPLKLAAVTQVDSKASPAVQLADVMIGAALEAANRLAGLMIWNGYGREAVVADIRSLSALMQRPLLDIGTGSDSDDSPSVDGDASTSSLGDLPSRPASTSTDAQLIVHTASGDGSGTPHEARFNIVRRSGCLWLRASG